MIFLNTPTSKVPWRLIFILRDSSFSAGIPERASRRSKEWGDLDTRFWRSRSLGRRDGVRLARRCRVGPAFDSETGKGPRRPGTQCGHPSVVSDRQPLRGTQTCWPAAPFPEPPAPAPFELAPGCLERRAAVLAVTPRRVAEAGPGAWWPRAGCARGRGAGGGKCRHSAGHREWTPCQARGT